MKTGVFLILFFSFFQVPAYNRSPADSLILPDGHIRHGRLQNGFQYFLRNTRDSNVTFKLVVKAGYRDEQVGQREAAHLLEHIVSGSTKNYPNIRELLSNFGLRLGKDFNASTGMSSTRYYVTIPSSDTAVIRKYVNIAYERFRYPCLDSLTIEREKKGLLSELGNPSKKETYSSEDLLGASWIDVNTYRSVQSVKKMKHDSLIAFFKRWYVADRCALIVVGNFDVEHVEYLIKRQFSLLPEPKHREEFLLGNEPIPPSYREFYDSAGNGNFVSVEMGHLFRSAREGTEMQIRRDVLSQLLNLMLENRLARIYKGGSMTEEFGSVKYYQKYLIPDFGIDGLAHAIVVRGSFSDEKIRLAILNYWYAIEQIVKFGFSDLEFENSVQKLRNIYTKAEESNTTYFLNSLERSFLEGTSVSIPSYLDSIRQHLLLGIKMNEVISAFRRWQASDISYLVVRSPTGLSETAIRLPMVLAIREEVRNRKIEPFPENVAAIKSIMTKRALKKIRETNVRFRRRDLNGLDVSVFELDNGINLILKRVVSSGADRQRVVMRAFRDGGAFQFSGRGYLEAMLSARRVAKAGLGRLTAKEFQDLKIERNIEVVPYVLPNEVGFHGECGINEVELMMQMVNQFIEKPDRKELRDHRMEAKDIAGEKQSVYDSIADTFQLAGECDDQNSGYQDVAFNKKNLLTTYKTMFSSVAGFTFIIIGDFDIESVKEAILPYLAVIGGNGGRLSRDYNHCEKRSDHRSVAYEVSEQPRKGTTVVNILIYNQSDGSAMNRAECMLVKHILAERLFNRLRIETGLVYNVRVTEDQSEDKQKFVVSFKTSKPNANQIVDEIWKEIHALTINPIPQERVSAAGYRAIKALDQNSYDFWQAYLSKQVKSGRPLEEINEIREILKILIDVPANEIVKHWLQVDDIVQIQAKGI